MNQTEERQTLLLIDRFKFMNLYPCNANELRSLDYKDSNNASYVPLMPYGFNTGSSLAANLALTNASMTNTVKSTPSGAASDDKPVDSPGLFSLGGKPKSLAKFPVPDTSKMYPFKPNKNVFSGLQPVPGGGMFLFPSVIAEMIRRLPAPSHFDGPFVAIDEFLAIFKNLNLPEDFEEFHKQANFVGNRLDLSVGFSIQPTNASPNEIMQSVTSNLKRPLSNQQNSPGAEGEEGKRDESDDSLDVFKQRHQSKIHKQS